MWTMSNNSYIKLLYRRIKYVTAVYMVIHDIRMLITRIQEQCGTDNNQHEGCSEIRI
jgi:hypothetical protein